MSFGGDMVDAYGVVRDFPAKSMIAGLLANALGWERYEADAHARLQERLVMGSARVAEGRRMRDFQTAKLEKEDKGWTTRGRREGRDGGSDTYKSPHIRYRDMDADARVLVALRLDPTDEEPTLDTLAAALDRPERPLFLGRKPFLPSRRLCLGFTEAATIREALATGLALLADPPSGEPQIRAQWPLAEGLVDHAREEELTDERHWPAGVHAGLRRVAEGHVLRPEPKAAAEATA
ncbi:MAG TPA: type I-E CRISPR-associated protein Cas5/CasD, partial [Geminicoccaceae bacterium]